MIIRSHFTLDVIEHSGVPRVIAACVALLDAMGCAADLNVGSRVEGVA
ncbi:hypothetical protein [Xylella fastidiosa]|nr:hypothetical protein [Xylella fastidiosa]AIC13520.1 hypothetical protein P303_01145 [Xylella fastidiosa MUL0034]